MIVKIDLSDDTSNQVVATYSCGCASAFTIELDESSTKLEITDQVLIHTCHKTREFCSGHNSDEADTLDNLLILQAVVNFNIYQSLR